MTELCARRTIWDILPMFLAGCLVLSCGALGANDIILLKDGKTIEGQILSEEEDVVVVKTASGREIINMQNVRQIRKEKHSTVDAVEEKGFLTPKVIELIEKAERLAQAENIDDSYRYYQKAAVLEDSIALHRRMARLYFNIADRIKNRHMSEFNTTLAAWEIARQGAWEDRRSLHEGMKHYKKFNPENPAYKVATQRHQESLKKINQCFPCYEKAQTAFGSVLRLSKFNKDFEAAGHLPLCLTVKNEVNTLMRGRQLLRSFLDSYKPGNEVERALYRRCQDELDRVTKD